MARRVTHLIVGLGKGGAETMLYQILKYQSNQTLTHHVISLGASHYYEELICSLGVEVTESNIRKNPVQTLWKIYSILRHTDTLCCWMYHCNFLGYLIGKLAHVPKLIWCIRHSNLNPNLNKNRTLQINTFCARHSAKISAIAYNGDRARTVHQEIGYCDKNSVVLDNGCDCDEFAPMSDAQSRLQKELHLPKEKKIIVSVTKDHPIKDVPTFLSAFGQLHKINNDIVTILCGIGLEYTNEILVAECEKNGLVVGTDVFLLGLRHDIPVLLSACDLYVLHSAGEAFPNALLQAMSCGCLCLTTDVGDARRILGQDDCVVPSENEDILYRKMQDLLSLSSEKADLIRAQNRARVMEYFDIKQIVKSYEELF